MRILWIPHTGWHIPQRAHLFCRALAERHEVHVTDLIADLNTVRDYVSLRYLRNFTYRRYRDGAITVHGVPRFSPALFFPALRKLNQTIFSWLVQQIIRTYRIDVVVGTFVVPPPKAPRLVFDLFDDNIAYWRSYGHVSAYADEIAQTENAYLRTADAIVAVSPVLAERARERGARNKILIIPNGVNLSRFEYTKGDEIRRELKAHGPLVGSVGSHDKAFELDNIIGAAKILASENITFLIAGRGNAIPQARAYVQREGVKNILWKRSVPFDQAADVISALDVGLCPYKKTPGADASSPMRLLMYTAAGIPTVCTDLASVRAMDLPNIVLVKDNSQGLAEGIRAALQLNKQRPSEIYKYDIKEVVRNYESILIDSLSIQLI